MKKTILKAVIFIIGGVVIPFVSGATAGTLIKYIDNKE